MQQLTWILPVKYSTLYCRTSRTTPYRMQQPSAGCCTHVRQPTATEQAAGCCCRPRDAQPVILVSHGRQDAPQLGAVGVAPSAPWHSEARGSADRAAGCTATGLHFLGVGRLRPGLVTHLPICQQAGFCVRVSSYQPRCRPAQSGALVLWW